MSEIETTPFMEELANDIEILKARDQVVYRACFEREFSTVLTREYTEVYTTGLAISGEIVLFAESECEYEVPELVLP